MRLNSTKLEVTAARMKVMRLGCRRIEAGILLIEELWLSIVAYKNSFTGLCVGRSNVDSDREVLEVERLA